MRDWWEMLTFDGDYWLMVWLYVPFLLVCVLFALLVWAMFTA